MLPLASSGYFSIKLFTKAKQNKALFALELKEQRENQR